VTTGRECYHCKQWIEPGEAHDCWTTTEAALTEDLAEDLREAWERLREAAADLGPQRIYASHKSIMFARRSCYCFVRPKRSFLELCLFLGRPLVAPQVKRVERSSRLKFACIVLVRHRDEVEAPLTDWLREAYDYSEQAKAPEARTATRAAKGVKRAAGRKRSADGTASRKPVGGAASRTRKASRGASRRRR
jgi:hypothetical protein